MSSLGNLNWLKKIIRPWISGRFQEGKLWLGKGLEEPSFQLLEPDQPTKLSMEQTRVDVSISSMP